MKSSIFNMAWSAALLTALTLSCGGNRAAKTQTAPTAAPQEAATTAATPTDFRDDKAGIDMVFVEGGTFTMGCTAEQGRDCYSFEEPEHEVALSSFYIAKYEVTQELWTSIMGSNPSVFKGEERGDDNLPVENVSWNDIQEFMEKLNAMTGKTYRLPTEAEWEYAARGGNNSGGYKYSGGDNIDNVAWSGLHRDNSGRKERPVGTKQANELGIHDMSGNVMEWVNDWYGNYRPDAQTNPEGPKTGSQRVLRGGSWDHPAQDSRVSHRSSHRPHDGFFIFGFRVAMSAPDAPAITATPPDAAPQTADVPIDMVFVQGGTFQMGCTAEQGSSCAFNNDEKPVRSVTVKGFYMAKYETTQELWKMFRAGNPSWFTGDDSLPVENISWNDVQAFIKALNGKTGRKYRLPTEAEWEYAARGGNKSNRYKYSGGNNIDDVAWYEENSGGKPHKVGTKTPNELGIHDMSGNVWEFVNDRYGYYDISFEAGPMGGFSKTSRVIRGGGGGSEAKECRVSNRGSGGRAQRFRGAGFRLAHDAESGEAEVPAAGTGGVYVKNGYRHLDPEAVPLEAPTEWIFPVPEPNAAGFLDGRNNGISLVNFGGNGKKPEFRVVAQNFSTEVLGMFFYRFSPNFSEDVIVYSKTRIAVIANVKTGKAFHAGSRDLSMSDYMLGIRFLDPHKNLFVIVKSIYEHNGWKDYLSAVTLEKELFVNTGWQMYIGETYSKEDIPLYHTWFVHDRKLFVYDSGKILCTDGYKPVSHPFSEAFNRNSGGRGAGTAGNKKDSVVHAGIGNIKDVAIHPALPFGVLIEDSVSSSGKFLHQLRIVRWEAQKPNEQIAALNDVFEPLAPLFGMERVALAYQSFSPDGNWYVVGCIAPELARPYQPKNLFFVAIPVDRRRSDFLAVDNLVVLGQSNNLSSRAWTTGPAAFVVANGDNHLSRWVLDGLGKTNAK